MTYRAGPTQMFVHVVQETVKTLEETLRDLRAKVEVQRKSEKDLEDRKDGLSKELTSLR